MKATESFFLPSSRAALRLNLPRPLPPPFSSFKTSHAVSKCMLTWNYLQHTSSLHKVCVVKCNSHSGTSKQYSMVGHKQDRLVSNQLRQTVTLWTVFCCSFKVWIIGKVIIETAVSLMVHVKNFFLQHSWKPLKQGSLFQTILSLLTVPLNVTVTRFSNGALA